MEGKVKNCVSQVNTLQKLNKGQTILFRQFKEHEIRITDNHHLAKDDNARLEANADKVATENKERDRRIEDLEVLHLKLKDREEELYA